MSDALFLFDNLLIALPGNKQLNLKELPVEADQVFLYCPLVVEINALSLDCLSWLGFTHIDFGARNRA